MSIVLPKGNDRFYHLNIIFLKILNYQKYIIEIFGIMPYIGIGEERGEEYYGSN